MPNFSEFFFKFENHCMFRSCSQAFIILFCKLNAQKILSVKKISKVWAMLMSDNCEIISCVWVINTSLCHHSDLY